MPDLVVGIDFGQTCTGVAYAVPSQTGNNVRWVQHWPGRFQANENKVPTILVYPHRQKEPSSWGFGCDNQVESNANYGVTCDWFKTLLDPMNLEAAQKQGFHDTTTHEDVRHWYRDYFSRLYSHIEQELPRALVNFEWAAAKIEFLFSMPTTWNHGLVEDFRDLVHEAGFGGPDNPSHAVIMSLTEAEAAAVHVSTESADSFRKGDILVVCDAGGGTTDLCALEVIEDMTGSSQGKQLKQVDVVGGENIGSVGIDLGFERRLQTKLQEADNLKKLDIDIEQAAWEMAKGPDFQNAKCGHGAPYEPPRFAVPIRKLPEHYRNEEAGITSGQMLFDKNELRLQFDVQIEKLFRLIDRQISSVVAKLPDQQRISHLVLSGGLGRSSYVQQRLIEHYRNGSVKYANTQAMEVRVAPDPQLAVCKGIVADRLRKLKAGHSVLGWRCCRASYGVICRELYDKQKHVGRPTYVDVQDSKLYVDNCVEWFITKGTPMSVDQPVSREFFRKLKPGLSGRRFPTRIAVSYMDRSVLPDYVEPGVEKLCEVEADLTFADEKNFKDKYKRFWRPGEHVLEVRFTVKVVLGAADVNFQLWFENQKVSADSSIKVDWFPVTNPPIPTVETPVPSPRHEDPRRSSKDRMKLPFIKRYFSGG
ncbi:hypothetical protein M409DRAFT_55439 [Zasmidium cellare ATCC 36951]|uniref:Actin-like ATPase domain-containing protein n=1 Tax=Zasmidium cellare ATCC 36951 TaxID=1080233 RepID=A0A6A6CFT0_ZASCE|nr:uncharacterized protein M409DRAFT_55439 [Zasmidium cellare ATCC 36951]KAF2166097.1 hypothetical protein M409DRAFT_55439 [Zasmidium cellare ATCC 36951]